MSDRPDELIQRASFNALVDQGIYSDEFEHPPFLQRFFAEMLQQHTPLGGAGGRVRVLDCGCGTGAWLSAVWRLAGPGNPELELFGFDISDRMVELAAAKLSAQAPAGHFKRGDLLDPAAYRFEAAPDGFDVVYAFDSVQQLPPARQFECCERMLEQVRPGGSLVIFDHDARSPYGRSMARKKFLTRYFGLRLVPRYYCNAKYPRLSEFERRLNARPGLESTLVAAPDSPKMALIVKRSRPE